jgi:hypothetical protein
MHDQVRAEQEWILQTGRGECTIDDEEGTAGMCFLSVGGDVEGCSFGVDGCFEEDYVSLFEERGVAVQV